jgi:hypothetical protein
MPPNRRSQNLPLVNQEFSTPIGPNRGKKLSERTRQSKTATRAASKASADERRARIAAAADEARSAVWIAAGLLAAQRVAVMGPREAIRRAEEAEENRQSTIRIRVAEQIASRREERERLVAEFGEEDAAKLQAEANIMRRAIEEPSTSDVEEMEIEEILSDPTVAVSASLRVNKVLVWSNNYLECVLSRFPVWTMERELHEQAEKQEVSNTISRMATVRAVHHRATQKKQYVKDFTVDEWDKVQGLIMIEARSWGPKLSVKIEVLAEKTSTSGHKPPTEWLSSDPVEPSTPRPRATRTTKALDAARIRADALANAGNFDRELISKWQCIDDNCRNHKRFCFVDFNGKHFAINATHQAKWAKAIASSEPGVSLERPPTALYEFWVRSQGGVTQETRRKGVYEARQEVKAQVEESKDVMTRLMDFTKANMEMRLSEAMINQVERMGGSSLTSTHPAQQQQPPHPQQQSQWQSQHPTSWQQNALPVPYTQFYPAPLAAQAGQIAKSQVPQLQVPPQVPGQSGVPRRHVSPVRSRAVPRISSPIGLPEEEAEIIEDFFQWKMDRAVRQEVKNRILTVYRQVEAEMWSINDLKAMSTLNSPLYKRAIELGIPDGMLRSFHTDLRVFKPHWRDSREQDGEGELDDEEDED